MPSFSPLFHAQASAVRGPRAMALPQFDRHVPLHLTHQVLQEAIVDFPVVHIVVSPAAQTAIPPVRHDRFLCMQRQSLRSSRWCRRKACHTLVAPAASFPTQFLESWTASASLVLHDVSFLLQSQAENSTTSCLSSLHCLCKPQHDARFSIKMQILLAHELGRGILPGKNFIKIFEVVLGKHRL